MAGPGAIQQGEPAQPPPEIKFKQACSLPQGRQQVYDAQTGVFHIHFQEPQHIGGVGSGLYQRSALEVTKVADRFAKPVVFRLTGVPEGYGCLGDPLTFSADTPSDDSVRGGQRYALEDDPLARGPVDQSLFLVERKQDVVTVEFTPKGQALLKPGAQISFKFDTGW